MMERQRGTVNLFWLAVFMGGFAALAMAALFSMRHERNLFAEAWAGAGRAVGSSAAVQASLGAVRHKLPAGNGKPAPAPGPMRRCLIDGKKVISNVDCTAGNATSVVIKIHPTRGIEAPKAPPPAPAGLSATDRMIDKASN
jgi:hypothetical protein